MRILLAGDTHGNLSHVQYLARTAREITADRVVILGDFGYMAHTKNGVQFLDTLNRFLGIRGLVTVYFLDGNHDKTSLLMAQHGEDRDAEGFVIVRPNIRYAPRGHRWTWAGLKFIALGGAWSPDKKWRLMQEAASGEPETWWFPEEEMSDQDLVAILQNKTPVDFILAHDKPRGSNCGWDTETMLDTLPNQDRMQLAIRTLKPAAFYHGHLHHHYVDFMQYSTADRGDVRTVKVTGLDCDGSQGKSWALLDFDLWRE